MSTESTIISIPMAASTSDAVVSGQIYNSDSFSEMPVSVGDREFNIIRWGDDNQLPYKVKELVEKNSVMSQNKLFNTLTCYGRGLEYMDAATMGEKQPKPTTDSEIRMWLMRNNMKRFFAEQVVDMKYYHFSVTVVILDRDRKNIVRLVHKDACHCRFTKADKKTGKVEYVLFADWYKTDHPDNIEVLPLLDEQDPYGDLVVRCGGEDPMGIFSNRASRNQTKFAIVTKMPGVGCQYYPIPADWALYLDGWYDMYGLLTAVKKAKLKNGNNIRYHVEINTAFWEARARSNGVSMGTPEFEEMKKTFLEEIRNYLAGSENSNKMLWSEFNSTPDGKEQHYLKIDVVDDKKAGNEYNDDVAEASNVLCYSSNVHPNLAGATPGKSQMNNSGSDKRELFTMKQALETLPHDMMMTVHNTIIYFNGWQDKVVPVVPMILLTTLDKNTDAKETNMNNQNTENNGNSN